MMIQDLSKFSIADSFRGRNRWVLQLWQFVESTFFRHSPWIANDFRCWILRCFGAKIGKKVVVRPTVKIPYPWKITIGDYSWVGEDVVLYSLAHIYIGSNTVISQRSYLCAGYHDYQSLRFEVLGDPVVIADQVWIATDVFIAPGVTVGKGTVVGARSSVFQSMPEYKICIGSPCRPIKDRRLR